MKLKFALIFSACALSHGGALSPGTIFAKVASGEVASSQEALFTQISQQKERLSALEAENARLRKAVEALKALAYGPGGQSSGSAAPSGGKHVIQAGETVSQIAGQYGVTRETLMQVNGIVENQQLYVGDELIVPPAPEPPQVEEPIVAGTPPVKTEQVPPPSPTPAPEGKTTPPLEKMTTIAWSEAENEETRTNAAPAKEEAEPKQTAKVAPEPKPKPVTTKTPEVKPKGLAKASPAPEAEQAGPPTPVTVADAGPDTGSKKENRPSSASKAQTAKESAPAAQKTQGTEKEFTHYTIKFGDNLGKIAKKHDISIGALMSFNGIKNPDKISGGQKLKIPSREKAKSLPKIRPSSATAMASTDGKPLPGDAYGIYTVQTGDTLYDLARDFFTTEKEIQQLNKLGNKTNIVPGQELIVPMAEYSKKSNLVTSTEGS